MTKAKLFSIFFFIKKIHFTSTSQGGGINWLSPYSGGMWKNHMQYNRTQICPLFLFGTQYWIVRYAKHTKLWFLYGMGRRIWVYEDIYISCLNKYGTGVIGDLFRHFPFDNSPCFINTFWTNKARMIGLGSFERSFQELSKRHQIYVNSSKINRVMTYQRW